MDLATDDEVRAALDGHKRGSRGWLWGAIVVVLVALTWYLWPRAERGVGALETVAVERGDLQVTITAVGTLQPLDEVSVSSELSGIVRQVYVETNDTVMAGQVLAELDDQVLNAQARQTAAQVQASRASVRQALANASSTKLEYDRAQSLAAKGATSTAALDQARAAHEVAVAALALAEAQLRQARAADDAAKLSLEKTKILAPIDGVVLERNVEPGQAVVSALQAATLFRVAKDLGRMTVDVEIDEADVGRIEPGQTADFTVAAYPDRVFDAAVVKVDLAPTTAAEVVTYGAELQLDNPDLILRPGMTATAVIATEAFEEVLMVPNAALRFEPANSSLPPPESREGRRVERVWMPGEGDPQPFEVLPVSTDGRRTAIEEGPLSEGDLVVVGSKTVTR